MLEIKGVKKSYGEFQLDCSLNVEKGRITGLVGENGAGKSTLFKAVLGLISYDAGEIKILGKTQEELSEKEKEELGVVLAEAGGKGIETGMTAATIQLGKMGIIHGARTYVIQNEDGQIEEPYSISAGLDYPGIGPIHANLAAQRRANVLAINDDEAIEAAYELTKFEGIIPALESAHALGALKKLKFKPEDVVVLTVSGRGDKDIETYLSFNEEKQDN